MKIIKLIFSFLTDKVIDLITSVCGCFKEFFTYKKLKEINKTEERKQKINQEYLEKAEKIVKNGSIQDLVNLRK